MLDINLQKVMSEMKLDRKLRPVAQSIGKIPFEFPESRSLQNGSPLFVYRDNQCEVVKIEFQFPAGTAYSKKRLDAIFTNNLITSGTSSMTEKEIAEKIDYYGAYFEKHVGNDEASFSVYSLKKYAGEVLKIVSEVLHDPIFPEQEVETLRNIKKQKFLVKCEKVDFLARTEFANQLFGAKHPYGGKAELNDYESISRDDLLKFHSQHYAPMPVVMAAGNFDDGLEKELNNLFGKDSFKSSGPELSYSTPQKKSARIIIDKKDVVQSAIRIGRLMFNRKHKDFPAMQVLVTVLGGYFGSRLMSNLREDKGFTYGVGAGLASMLHEGYFFISTEVGADTTLSAEEEIHFELNKLRNEKVPQAELDLVKNYLLGQILKSTDGVFSRLNRFKTMQLFGQTEEDFRNLIETIRNVTSNKLLDLAVEWFGKDDMLTVIAGRVKE